LKVVILAGGRGTRLSEETHAIPKPMVLIGGRPIIWHIMKHYASYGFSDFVVACGYKGHILKEFFSTYGTYQSDLEVDFATGTSTVLTGPREDWKVTLIDTGEDTRTGGRIKRVGHLLGGTFLLTYGDGLCDVPIDKLVAEHQRAGTRATVTAVNPVPRWGALRIEEDKVVGFAEKPADPNSWINGGYFVLERDVLDLIEGDDTGFEQEPMECLADQRQLSAFRHRGFWMAMDTARDRDELNALWSSGNPPWIPH
jgi:glucose-1-phosphate cytidylyltransferase